MLLLFLALFMKYRLYLQTIIELPFWIRSFLHSARCSSVISDSWASRSLASFTRFRLLILIIQIVFITLVPLTFVFSYPCDTRSYFSIPFYWLYFACSATSFGFVIWAIDSSIPTDKNLNLLMFPLINCLMNRCLDSINHLQKRIAEKKFVSVNVE